MIFLANGSKCTDLGGSYKRSFSSSPVAVTCFARTNTFPARLSLHFNGKINAKEKAFRNPDRIIAARPLDRKIRYRTLELPWRSIARCKLNITSNVSASPGKL